MTKPLSSPVQLHEDVSACQLTVLRSVATPPHRLVQYRYYLNVGRRVFHVSCCLVVLPAAGGVPAVLHLDVGQLHAAGEQALGLQGLGQECSLELQMKVHSKVRNHEEGPYYLPGRGLMTV